MPEYSIDPKDVKWALRLLVFVAALWAFAQIAPILWPQQQQAAQPAFYYPDPTPYVVETQHTEVNIFSKNCFGNCPSFQP